MRTPITMKLRTMSIAKVPKEYVKADSLCPGRVPMSKGAREGPGERRGEKIW